MPSTSDETGTVIEYDVTFLIRADHDFSTRGGDVCFDPAKRYASCVRHVVFWLPTISVQRKQLVSSSTSNPPWFRTQIHAIKPLQHRCGIPREIRNLCIDYMRWLDSALSYIYVWIDRTTVSATFAAGTTSDVQTNLFLIRHASEPHAYAHPK